MIELRGIAKTFDGGASFAVQHADLTADRGAFLAVVGESGSGKSTLIKTINRLVEPDAGTVRIDGREAASEPAHLLRRRIGYVAQDGGLFPHLSVGENIAVTPRLLAWPRARIAERVQALLELVRLPATVADRSPRQLSGGQRQRVAVARALAAEPAVMLMDEPFGALDAIVRDDLVHEYRRLHEALGLTTVMITHDMQEAVLLADHIAVMHLGRIVADGAPHQLLADDADPYARRLMDAPRRQAEVVARRLAASRGPTAGSPVAGSERPA